MITTEKKDRSQLLRELMDHYVMPYGESDAEERLSLIMAKKGKRSA